MRRAPHANPRPEHITTASARATETGATQRSRAIRTVVRHALDGRDRACLLAMLGLNDEPQDSQNGVV